MVKANIQICPFQQKDRESLLRIAADTAFFGAPVENFMEDRRIFLDAFYVYYTDHEADHCWVAKDGEVVIGFLTGCFNTRLQREYTARILEPQALRKFISGKYRIGSKFIRYIIRYYLSKLSSPKDHLDLSQFPAHFHINLSEEWRGYGIGRKLIERFLDQLESANICGVHLQTTSYNKAAKILYERMGFTLLDFFRSLLWQGLVDEPIYELIYGMKL
ncbi:MAG: GNAT family N-acetyltransferase [Chloroflexota bacterium]|nr:MAG: hypothetical protein KatS3mg047_0857 [Bellilinea sp.]